MEDQADFHEHGDGADMRSSQRVERWWINSWWMDVGKNWKSKDL